MNFMLAPVKELGSGQWMVGRIEQHIARPLSKDEIDQLIEEHKRLKASQKLLLDACVEFVRKCDAGEAKSVRSYQQMKEAIAAAEGVK